MIEQMGNYRVLTARNGQEAMEILLHTAVDMVLTDISMPFMNGIELLRQINMLKKKIVLGQRRIIESKTAANKKEPAEASPFDFSEPQSGCQRRAGSQNEIRQSEQHMQLCANLG